MGLNPNTQTNKNNPLLRKELFKGTENMTATKAIEIVEGRIDAKA